METHQIDRSDSRYPAVLTERLCTAAPVGVAAMGRVEILRHNRLRLICSIRCPGSIVIKIVDAIIWWVQLVASTNSGRFT